jgi:arylformamidase
MSVLYDISPLISADLKVWPGDTVPSREVLLDTARGDMVTLSTLRTTVHAGSHADGPNHYGPMPDGSPARSIDEQPLEHYLGPCLLIDAAVERGERVGAAHLDIDLDNVDLPGRVLIRTGTFPDAQVFNEDFAAISPELVESLSGRGVITIGIDTPSVDLFPSKDLPAHKAFLRTGVAILEGLVLVDVPAGMYELIALPLRLAGFDGSPVRAVLRSV